MSLLAFNSEQVNCRVLAGQTEAKTNVAESEHWCFAGQPGSDTGAAVVGLGVVGAAVVGLGVVGLGVVGLGVVGATHWQQALVSLLLTLLLPGFTALVYLQSYKPAVSEHTPLPLAPSTMAQEPAAAGALHTSFCFEFNSAHVI